LSDGRTGRPILPEPRRIRDETLQDMAEESPLRPLTIARAVGLLLALLAIAAGLLVVLWLPAMIFLSTVTGA